MASPAIRQRIREGMMRAKVCAELAPFLAVWAALSDEARAVALHEIHAQASDSWRAGLRLCRASHGA
jgi:hypothetical protein